MSVVKGVGGDASIGLQGSTFGDALRLEVERAGPNLHAEGRSSTPLPAPPGDVGGVDVVFNNLAGRVEAAGRSLDLILKQAESGRTFTPAELLALQARAYSASQEIDLAGKIVEKATSSVKQVLQTQV